MQRKEEIKFESRKGESHLENVDELVEMLIVLSDLVLGPADTRHSALGQRSANNTAYRLQP